MMDITTLRKKVIIGLLGLGVLIGLGGVVYVVSDYGVDKKPQSQNASNVDLPNGTRVAVTVNNFLNSIPNPVIPESKSAIIAPHSVSSSESTRTVGQLMVQSPTTLVEKPKPKMLVVDSGANNSEQANAITGTNTTIGTGTIDSKLSAQKSPYTVFAGTFIPATMITGLNSELNGVIVASIRNDVYDSTTGKYLLIPQGSKMIGTYNHDVAYGQDRLMVGWNRIIYPNGTSFLLHGQPGTDLEGFAGFGGSVDNHYSKIFGSAFLMGLIFGGTTLATGQQTTNPYQMSAGATIATQVGAQMGQAGLQVVSRGLNIPPTITISPGYRFNVLTTADLILKPYIFN